MKKYSTNLSKHFPLIIIVISLAASVFSLSAEEYKSMIRYDRVWEHIYIHWGDTRAYHVRFAGTEEINGKTYHRLEAFREIYYTYDYDTTPKVLSVNNNYYAHEGYMREEDGKVYTLVAVDDSDKGYHEIFLYTPDMHYLDSYRIEEKVLYDFTRKEGEIYRGLQIGVEGEEMDYKVTAIEHVEIDGEDHRLQHITVYNEWADEWDEYSYNPMVEGIGIASYGCLTTINFLHLPTCPCMNHIFNRVLSTDGRVLYRTEDLCAEIPVADLFGVDGIAEIEEQSESDTHLYDILGRRIAEPAPGQLYIQGGKKRIDK